MNGGDFLPVIEQLGISDWGSIASVRLEPASISVLERPVGPDERITFFDEGQGVIGSCIDGKTPLESLFELEVDEQTAYVVKVRGTRGMGYKVTIYCDPKSLRRGDSGWQPVR